MRWTSNFESVDAGEISWLALLETLVAVVLYALAALFAETVAVWGVPAVFAPILLLRTRFSTNLAVLFYSLTPWGAQDAPSATAKPSGNSNKSLVVGAWIVTAWNNTFGQLLRFVISFRPKSEGLLFSLFQAGIFCTWLNINALFSRGIASVVGLVMFPFRTLKRIPHNWWRVVACVDLATEPEAVPSEDHKHSLVKTIAEYRDIEPHLTGWHRCCFLGVFWSLMVPSFLASWAYRWSVKATALFYGPFIWIAYKATRDHVSATMAKHSRSRIQRNY